MSRNICSTPACHSSEAFSTATVPVATASRARKMHVRTFSRAAASVALAGATLRSFPFGPFGGGIEDASTADAGSPSSQLGTAKSAACKRSCAASSSSMQMSVSPGGMSPPNACCGVMSKKPPPSIKVSSSQVQSMVRGKIFMEN
eukprot:2881715-Rhodomonas_salina.2